MSLQDMLHPAEPPSHPDTSATKDAKQPMRSWRKKFRKLKLRFDRVMEESNRLFTEEHKDIARARRIQEENDQYMEILLSLNTEAALPDRYSLGFPGDEELGLDTYPQYTTMLPELRPLTAMVERIPHTRLSNGVLLEDVAGDKPPGYLDGVYEEEYLANLDAQLEENNVDPPFYIRPPASRQIPSEKDLYNANPNSVVSWLRRHHPETFIQEKDAEKEKAPAKPRGPGKRASIAAVSTPVPKVEADYDEDGYTMEATPRGGSGRGKRTKDDAPYRPKGGSSKSNKRKRAGEDGAVEKGSVRGKRAKQSLSAAAET